MGDSTILANRSQYVDFTSTYTDLGIGTLAKQNNNDMWIFLMPLDVKLWISIVGFALVIGSKLHSSSNGDMWIFFFAQSYTLHLSHKCLGRFTHTSI